MSMDSGETDKLLTEAKRNFAKAAAQAEVAAAEKEAKMKMCKYSPDLPMECGCFPRMFNNSIRPFSQCKQERWRGITAEEERGLIII